MKKCCENNNNNTNDGLSFDPCYKDRGYIIRLFIDSCSTTPIYPVTSLDAVTVKINTLDSDVKACLNSKIGNLTDKDEITLKELLESGCIIGSGEGSGGPDVHVKNVSLNNNHLIFTFENSNKTLDVDLSNFAPSASSDTYINEASLDNTTLKLGYNSQTPELEVDLSNLIPSIMGNAYRIEVIDNGNNTILNFVYDDLHVKEDKEILSITISDNKAIFSYWDEGREATSMVTYSLSGDPTSGFIPGYYLSKTKLIVNEEIDVSSDNFKYMGVDRTGDATFKYQFLYYVNTPKTHKLVDRYTLPSENYVYFVSTGNTRYDISEPIGEVAYFLRVNNLVVLRAFENIMHNGVFDSSGIIKSGKTSENIVLSLFTNPYLYGHDIDEDDWKYPESSSSIKDIINPIDCPLYGTNEPIIGSEDEKFVKILNEEQSVLFLKESDTIPALSNLVSKPDGNDCNHMINMILGKESEDLKYDYNGNGRVDGEDLSKAINYMLHGTPVSDSSNNVIGTSANLTYDIINKHTLRIKFKESVSDVENYSFKVILSDSNYKFKSRTNLGVDYLIYTIPLNSPYDTLNCGTFNDYNMTFILRKADNSTFDVTPDNYIDVELELLSDELNTDNIYLLDAVSGILNKLSDRYSCLWALPVSNFTGNKITSFENVVRFDLISNELNATRFPEIYYSDSIIPSVCKVQKSEITIDNVKWTKIDNTKPSFDIYDHATWNDVDKAGYALSYLLAYGFSSRLNLISDKARYLYKDYADNFGWSNQSRMYNFRVLDSNITLSGKVEANMPSDFVDGICETVSNWIFSISNGSFTISGQANISLGGYVWDTVNQYGYAVYNNKFPTSGLMGFRWIMPKVTVNSLSAICTHLVTNNDTTTVESTYINLSNS